MTKNYLFETLAKILSVYCLVLVIVGTVGNFMAFLTCIRKRLRTTSTFVFMSFLTIVDIFTLYTWNLNHFIQAFYVFNVQNLSIPWCRISSVIQYVSLQWSGWLLVTISIERFLCVKIKTWRTSYFNSTKAIYLSIGIGLVIFLINFHLFFTNGLEVISNGTVTITCYESPIDGVFPAWEEVHGFLYSIIPSTILTIMNSFLIYHTRMKNTPSAANASKRKHMTLSIIITTALFIVLTTPTAIAGTFFFRELFSTMEGRFVVFFCDSLAFSYHSLNFFVFFLFNTQFRLEWRNILSRSNCRESIQLSAT